LGGLDGHWGLWLAVGRGIVLDDNNLLRNVTVLSWDSGRFILRRVRILRGFLLLVVLGRVRLLLVLLGGHKFPVLLLIKPF